MKKMKKYYQNPMNMIKSEKLKIQMKKRKIKDSVKTQKKFPNKIKIKL